MTTENNKIIAEFMNHYENMGNKGLLYHSDWNWLMEVVEKILQSGGDTDQWDNVLNELQTINIENVYNACIEFIKWYNEQNK